MLFFHEPSTARSNLGMGKGINRHTWPDRELLQPVPVGDYPGEATVDTFATVVRIQIAEDGLMIALNHCPMQGFEILLALARIIRYTLALTPGTRLGVYEVTARVGEGRMG